MAMNYRKMGAGLARNAEEIERDAKIITDLYGGAEERQKLKSAGEDSVVKLSLTCLKENSGNHFSPIQGEKWDEFVASIKEQGVLSPIIVRLASGDGETETYEILAGHNRVRAAKEAGLTEIPAVIRNVDDVTAAFIIADTNLQRERVSDREKGWAYRNIYEAIKRTGQNQYTVAASQNGTEQNERVESAASQNGTMLRTDEIIARKYGVGRNTVNRKIRLTYLLPPLYEVYEDKKITQEVAEQFSYLQDSEQAQIVHLVESGITFDVEAAKKIRAESEARREAEGERPMSDVDILNAINVAAPDYHKQKAARPKKYSIDEDLFPAELKKGMRENYVAKALMYIRENGIDLEEV